MPGPVRVISILQGSDQKSTSFPEQLDFGKLTFFWVSVPPEMRDGEGVSEF